MGYPCADFGLPRPLCSRFGPDVRDRQTSDRRVEGRSGPLDLAEGSAIPDPFKDSAVVHRTFIDLRRPWLKRQKPLEMH